MRTTVTLDDDVVAALDRRRRELKRSLEQEVNDLIRAGLIRVEEQKNPDRPSFRVEPLDVGELLVDNLDDISAVLAMAEGEGYL
jgi:plasmid stability protein